MSRHLRKIIGLLAILHAAPALAGLDLTWNACNLSTIPGADDVTLDCSNPVSVVSLYANFQVPQTMQANILEGFIDVDVDATELPPFWDYVGCNSSGLSLTAERPDGPCPPLQNAAPWGTGFVTGTVYATRVPGIPNRIRWNILSRGAERGERTLSPGKNYFAFRLDVLSDAAGTCEGCGAQATMTWVKADIFGRGELLTTLSGPGLRGNFVGVNHIQPLLVLLRINPPRVPPNMSAILTIEGRNITPGATAKLTRDGAEIIGDSLVTSADGRELSGRFNLTGPAPSLWDVVVENPDGQRRVIADAFEIREALTLTSVTPDSMSIWGSANVALTGSELRPGTSLDLYRRFPGYSKAIPATSVSFASDAHSATGRFDLYRHDMDPNVDPGPWSVIAGSGIGADTLADAIELVTEPHIISVVPNVVADSGTVVLAFHGTGFVPAASALLVRDGDSSIAGIGSVVDEDGTVLTATFDVRNGAGGINWTAGMANPDGISSFLYGALKIMDSTTPVRLISRFEAELRGDGVELSWTASEPG